MDADQQLRNLRDFLLVYNRMTEICFQRCTSNFNYRNLTMDEERCVDSCAGKLIRSNHRLMGTYVQLMPRMVQRRMEEMESKAAENAKAAEAAATDASSVSQSLITSSPPLPQTPALLPSLGTDAGPEAHGSVLKPAGLEMPVEFDAFASKFTTATEKLSAATPLTPATEAVSPSVLNKAGNGPFSTAGFSQPPIAGAQTEPGGSVSVLIPSKPTSLLEDAPVSTVAAPTVSKSKESLPGRERAPEVPPSVRPVMIRSLGLFSGGQTVSDMLQTSDE